MPRRASNTTLRRGQGVPFVAPCVQQARIKQLELEQRYRELEKEIHALEKRKEDLVVASEHYKTTLENAPGPGFFFRSVPQSHNIVWTIQSGPLPSSQESLNGPRSHGTHMGRQSWRRVACELRRGPFVTQGVPTLLW